MFNQQNQVVEESVGALQNLWNQFVEFVPELIGAVLVLVIGWILAVIAGRLVTRFVHYIGADRWVRAMDSGRTMDVVGERLNREGEARSTIVSDFSGSVVKWVIVLLFLGVAADILNLGAVNEFLTAIVAYIPQAIVAIVILSIGLIASRFVGDFVGGSLSASDAPVGNRRLIASVARWSIIVFAVMAALVQLGIVPQLIQILFAGLVFALALAFGLGGRDHANDFIRSMRQTGQRSR